MADVDESLHAQVKSIVDELEAAASGSLYRVDGDWKVIDDIDEWKEAEYKKKVEAFKKEHPESEFAGGNGDQLVDGNGDVVDAPKDCYDSYEEWMEDEIGTTDDVDEPDEVSLGEYVDEQSLGDVRVEISLSDRSLVGGKVLFCYGGPNIWVADDEVRGYWGGSRCEMSLDSETRSALFSWFEEMWDMSGGR